MNERTDIARPAEKLDGTRAWVGAWAKISILQYFVAETVVIAAWRGPMPYSRTFNLISDLGAVNCGIYQGRSVCSPLHVVMNLSFLLQGLGLLLGALFLSSALLTQAGGRDTTLRRHRVAATLVRVLVALAGVGAALVGLVPEDTARLLHIVGAGLFFVPGGLSLVCFWWIWRRGRPVSGLLLACGVVSLVSLVVFLLVPGAHNGATERFVAYPITLGLAGVGAAIAVKARRARAMGRARRAAATAPD